MYLAPCVIFNQQSFPHFQKYKMRIDKIQLLGIGTSIQKQFVEPHLVYVMQAWLSFIHHYTYL